MSQNRPDHGELIAFAEKLADISGEILNRVAPEHPVVEFKEDSSYVTAIDKEIEAALRSVILAEYPEHGIMGEEFPSVNLEADLIWVIDPIDGTAPFIAGLPVYGTLIGLAWKGQPFIGVIDHPATSDRWVGVAGEFAQRNGQDIHCRPMKSLAQGLISCSNSDFMSPDEYVKFRKLHEKVAYVQYGGSCFAYGLIASGRIDAAIDAGMEPWDFFASAAVITGAGGRFTDWEGNMLTLESRGQVLASGCPGFHREILEVMNSDTI